MGLDVKALQVFNRQVNPATQCVLTHIAQDVGELQGLPQLVGIGGGLCLGLAKNTGRDFAHHTGHAHGVYLDDADSGDTVEANVFYRMGTGAGLGGGHDNIFRNNIAIECRRGFAIDARGVSRHYEKDATKLRDLAAVKTGEPPWSTRFPTLVNLLANHPELPTGCIVERNISVACEKDLDLRAKPDELRFSTVRENAALAMDDLHFADAATMDFRVASDAPMFVKVTGFAAIPFEKIGLYLDKYRKTLPAHPSGHTVSEWHRERDEHK